MAGLPPSPALANPAANLIPEFNTPAVLPGAVTFGTVHMEASRKKKLHQAVDDGITSGGFPLVTPAEAGMADARHASSIAQTDGAAVAPPWFAGALAAGLAAALPAALAAALPAALAAALPAALAPLEAQLANVSISRGNAQASKEDKVLEIMFCSIPFLDLCPG